MKNCKCGSMPKPPEKVKGLKDGYLIECESSSCPAKAQRVGLAKCQNAWDALANKS